MYDYLTKILRVARSIVLALIAFTLVVLLCGALYLKSNSGQKWLTDQTHQILTNALETEVSLDSAFLDFPRSLSLHNLTICDNHNNTVLSVAELDVQFTIYSFDLRSLVLSNIRLQEPQFYGRKYKGDTAFNYDYLIANAKSDDPKPKEDKIFRVLLDGVQITDGVFHLHNYQKKAEPKYTHGIDFNRLELADLNLKASYLQFIGPRLSADINHLSFKEQSGFKLDTLRTDFTFHKNSLDLQNLLIKTPNSRLADQITMTYDDKSDLQDFIKNVELITQFKSSTISFRDLSYFSGGVPNEDKRLHFSGNIKGTVADFSSDNFELAFGKQSFFQGDISLKGLPDFSQTFIQLKCESSRLHINDFQRLFPGLEPPLDLKKLGTTRFNGNFTGFPSDFVAYGDFRTALGTVQTDINLKLPGKSDKASYSGKLNLTDFDIGTLLDEDSGLGKITMSGNVKGTGLTLEAVELKLDGKAKKLVYNDYVYNKIKVNGAISDERFEGVLTVDDQELGLNFDGSIDLAKEKPAFNFKADLRHADLYQMNFVNDSMTLDSRVNLDFKASSPDNAEGNIKLYNTRIQLPERELTFDSLQLSSVIEEQDNSRNFKEVTLASDIVDMRLSGKYNLTSLADIAKMTASRIVDQDLIPGDTVKEVSSELNFDLHVHNAAFLMELAKTPLVLRDNTKASGYINTGTGDLTLESTIPGFYYKNWQGRNISIRGSGNDSNIFLKSQIAELKYKDSTVINDSRVGVQKTKGDSLELEAQLRQGQQHLNINASMLANQNELHGRLTNSEIHFKDTVWQVNSKAITYTYDSTLAVPLLTITNSDQQLTMSGEIGGPEAKPMRVIFDRVSLGTFTQDIFPQYKNLQGTVDGQVILQDLIQEPHFRGGLMVSSFQTNNDTIGDLRLSANYQPELSQINLNAGITNRELEPMMNMNGNISFQGDPSIYLKASFQQTRLSVLEGFVNDYISDLSGTFKSEVLVEGTLSSPDIEGYLDLNKTALTVNYLQTRYKIDEQITFDQNAINLRDLKIKDQRDKVAKVNGQIKHNYFDSLTADLTMEADNFKALNTTKNDNDVFYGQAYGSGFLNFTGPLGNITIDMQLRSEKGTVINLPVGGDSDYESYDYIHYVNDQDYYSDEFELNTGGVNLNIELEVTPDALVRIIFDPKTKDILQGRGQGNLQLNLTQAGEFEMYGNYTINEGDYLFTAVDVIRKRFQIKEGGTISWSGDPLEAEMDIQAAYQVKTSPAPLLPENANQNQAAQDEVPVEAQLFLTGSLFSPAIDLDFEILDRGQGSGNNLSALNSQIQRIKNNEQALNQQVVSLLVMNRFIRSSGVQASDALGASSNSLVGDLISNQLTYWVQQFSDNVEYLENVQLGIDYQGRTKTQSGKVNQQQMEVALSTSLFDDRVSISGSMDMQSSSGNVEVRYKLTQDGRVRVKVFSRNNNNPVLNRNIQKHGTGIIWQKSFDSWAEFFGREAKEKPEKPSDTFTNTAPADTAQVEPQSYQVKPDSAGDNSKHVSPIPGKGVILNRNFAANGPR